MIINRIYENQNLLSQLLVSFLVGLRTYLHPCIGIRNFIISRMVILLDEILYQMPKIHFTVRSFY